VTPNQMLEYKNAILLFKLYNSIQTTPEWIMLNFLTNTDKQIIKFYNFAQQQFQNWQQQTLQQTCITEQQDSPIMACAYTRNIQN
jgi:hypothetical protein